MATQHVTAATSLCELFNESKLCPDEILNILQTLDDKNTNNTFDAEVADTIYQVENSKNSTSNKTKKRKKPAKSITSSLLGLCSDEESDDGRALLSQRMIIKRKKGSLSPPATSMEDGSGEDGGGGGVGGSNDKNGKLVSHIAVERNRRKQMNEHLTVLRQLMPCFYAKKGDQSSIVGGVIDYINELHQVLQSLEAKKLRKIYTSEVGLSPRDASSPRFLAPRQYFNPSPLNPRISQSSPRPLINFPVTPRTPQSTSSFYKPMIPDEFKSNIGNDLVTSSKSNIADVQVKFCGPNLELKTMSSKIAGQTVKILLALEDLSLEILKLSINTAEETTLNTFTIKVGIDCQLSAEELAQQIQQTFC